MVPIEVMMVDSMARASRRIAPTEMQRLAGEAAIAKLEMAIKYLVTEYTVEFLAEKVRQDEYYVPPYQRELVWPDDKQSRFVESLLMGLPIPFLFLWQANDGRLEIVDGSQRLRTMVRFLDGDLQLQKLQQLPELNGFRFTDLDRSRQRKLYSRSIRGIVLDNLVNEAARTEMFNRINTGGTHLNEAEIRRGSLPGPFMELVVSCSTDQRFVAMTPVSTNLVNEREREELVVRFFTYLEKLTRDNGGFDLPGWKDRPREYIWAFVDEANGLARDDPGYLARLRQDFDSMLGEVERLFPFGFRKTATGKQIPRVRFEAIAVGTALALRDRGQLTTMPVDVAGWVDGHEFGDVTTSDAANVKSKLLSRISFVYERLM
ncbi:MAG: hypothetical protein ACD_54C00289G0003 [uncultured bacterium]|nr:MAG: hypothetical protein ACD_54C00289G0003 [uncultured bacterium]